MMARSSAIVFCASILVASATTPAAAAPAVGKARYERCLALAASNANAALGEAANWQKTGGGAASEHCMAVALVTLHRYIEAAGKLDALAHGALTSDPTVRKDLFDQAGNAWLLANKPDSAVASFTAALSIDPTDPDLLADRARANAMKKFWSRSESDLSAALLVSPDRADLLVLRGSARHAMGHKTDARADFERALKLHPGFVDALVERGTMKFEAGDLPGARADWLTVAATSPNSTAAATARQHLSDTEPVSSAPPGPANGAPPPLVLKPPKPH